ncbi:MAG: HD domain-containing protein [Deltaproteobacteria bacterium]|nr:HD domain-containing protein [Deltaproteobacteria bacterium]MBI3295678.1 HD domain-containing protein [Deltaproteobacteria bacterium]
MSASSYFAVRIQSVPVDRPLPFDVALLVAGNYVVFKREKDVLTLDRLDSLIQKGLKAFYISEEHRDQYRAFLKQSVQQDTLSADQRGRYIKESAFNHITDLFTQPNVGRLAEDSKGLVEDMVNFISSDISAAVRLMGLSNHDYYTYNHCVNVSVYSISIAKRVVGDDKNLLMTAGLGGLLHDLGKKMVDDKIINKPGKLDESEWAEMKRHPSHGIELLKGVANVSEEAKRVVHEHHEHLDGTGYPRGLTEENISQLSRIAAIADVFDALTTKRSYKEAMTADLALDVMLKMSPGKFDPTIFRYFEKRIPTKQDVEVAKGTDPCAPGFAIKKAG